MIAGGVESMTRAPFVMAKADSAFSRAAKIEDTTIGWRFVNPLMKSKYGIDSMPETAENVAADFKVSRADQDAFALRSQERAAAAIAAGRFAEEIVPVTIPAKKGDPVVFEQDEHPRATTLEALAKLKGVVRARRHGHRGQCIGRERRRMRRAARVGVGRREVRTQAPRARRRERRGGRAAAHHGLRAGARHAQAAGQDGIEDRRHERHRAQRSVCGPGARGDARPRALPTTRRTSIPTAARSRSVTRSARAARVSSPLRYTSSNAPADVTRSPRCASASGKASRS